MDYQKFSTFFNVFFFFSLALFILIVFFPGTATVDSMTQYRQALSGNYDTHHPIAMAAVWSLLLPQELGGIGLLVMQVILYCLGFYYWAQRFCHAQKISLFLLVLIAAVMPFNINFVGVLWKDSLNGVILFVVSSIFWLKREQFNVLKSIKIGVPLLFAGLIKPVTLPIIIVFFGLICTRLIKRKNFFLRIIAGAFVGIGFFIFSFVALDTWLQPKKTSTLRITQIYDLSGIAHYGGSIDFSALAAIDPNFKSKSKSFVDGNVRSLFWANPKGSIQTPENEKNLEILETIWAKTILKSPLEYLETRYNFFKNFLHWDYNSGFYIHAVTTRPLNSLYDLKTSNILKEMHTNWIKHFEFSIVFKGWFWVFILIVQACIALTWILKDNHRKEIKERGIEIFLVCASIFGVYVIFFLFGQAQDFRYYYGVILLQVVIFFATLNSLYTLPTQNKSQVDSA